MCEVAYVVGDKWEMQLPWTIFSTIINREGKETKRARGGGLDFLNNSQNGRFDPIILVLTELDHLSSWSLAVRSTKSRLKSSAGRLKIEDKEKILVQIF